MFNQIIVAVVGTMIYGTGTGTIINETVNIATTKNLMSFITEV